MYHALNWQTIVTEVAGIAVFLSFTKRKFSSFLLDSLESIDEDHMEMKKTAHKYMNSAN
jgi:hypothetical protein